MKQNHIQLKRLGLVVTTVTGLCLGAAATAQPVFQPDDSGGDTAAIIAGPRATFEVLSHDFGDIPDTESVTHHFKFRNTGQGLLMIDHVKSTCHCTAGEIKIHDYLPGEGGAIDVTYDPTTRRGPQAREVTVYTNDPVTPMVVLKITANVKPIVELEPFLVNFGEIIAGGHGAQTLKVRSAAPNFAIQHLKIEDPTRMKATIGEAKSITLSDGRAATEFEIQLETIDTSKIGTVAQSVTLTTNIPSVDGKQDFYTLQFATAGNVVTDIMARPARLTLGAFQPGNEFSRDFELKSRTDKPFKVLSVEVKPLKPFDIKAEVVTELTAEGLPMTKIRVSGIAPEEAGQVRGTIVIVTDSAEAPTLEVPFNGVVRRATPTLPPANPQPAANPGGGGGR